LESGLVAIFKNCRRHGPRGLNLDIDGWLGGIGLAQYTEMFLANDIDDELLGGSPTDRFSFE
jgi:hypothetical protein